jgi:hypothetical protein
LSTENEWSDEDDEEDSEEDASDSDASDSEESLNKFGPIPRFSRVYKDVVDPDTLVFSCTCCHQKITGMPCCHIASICRSNKMMFEDNLKGFPLSPILYPHLLVKQILFVWHVKETRSSKIEMNLVALADNDTEGVAFPSSTRFPTMCSRLSIDLPLNTC